MCLVQNCCSDNYKSLETPSGSPLSAIDSRSVASDSIAPAPRMCDFSRSPFGFDVRLGSHLVKKTESGKAEANRNSRKDRNRQAKCTAYCEFRLASAFPLSTFPSKNLILPAANHVMFVVCDTRYQMSV